MTTDLTRPPALGHTAQQVERADTFEDHLKAEEINWRDANSDTRRRLLSACWAAGLDLPTSEQAVEVYLRAINVYVDACAVAAGAARNIGNTHAALMGVINTARRDRNEPPISGVQVS